jgi:Tol biopolymer transport system component
METGQTQKNINKNSKHLWGILVIITLVLFTLLAISYKRVPYILNFMLSARRRVEARLRTPLYEKGKILFSRNERLYVMNADGENLRSLSNLHGVHDFKWSPDGSRVAFTDYLSLYVINSDGSNLHELDTAPGKANSGWEILHPIWSPSGSKLSYEKENLESYKMSVRNIITSKANGTDRYNIDSYLFDFFIDGYPNYCGFASWTQDGVYLLFSCFEYPILTGYKMRATGSEPAQLVEIIGYGYPFFWSPDGNKIAFASNKNGEGNLQVMNVDGSDAFRMLPANGEVHDLNWSPNSQRILFSSGKEKNQEIYMVNADGSNLIRLTNNNFIDKNPAWSPNGDMIVFSSDRDGNLEIYVMNLDGSNEIRLTYNVEADENPQWSR